MDIQDTNKAAIDRLRKALAQAVAEPELFDSYLDSINSTEDSALVFDEIEELLDCVLLK